jgi:glyoxylase-like metal-dependent hydrolase (beta-lactamase superfamily II)
MSSQVQRQAKLTACVHTYASSEGGILANAYLIETSEGVVAIDATLTVSDANHLRALLDSLERQLLAVLITHGHPDHYNGLTQLIAGTSVPIIATEGVDRVIREWDAKKEAQWKPMFGDEWPAQRTFPNRIAQDSESFVFGDVRFTVHDLGPGESHHDSYWIAEDGRDKVAFIGDLAFNGEHSYVSDGHTSRWLENLDRTREALAGVTRIYPGHGPAGGSDLFERQRLYLERYREEIQKLANGRAALTEADKTRLTEQMTEYLPGGRINFLIAAGADAVASELAEPRGIGQPGSLHGLA